jgi:hypothetical protein
MDPINKQSTSDPAMFNAHQTGSGTRAGLAYRGVIKPVDTIMLPIGRTSGLIVESTSTKAAIKPKVRIDKRNGLRTNSIGSRHRPSIATE